MSQPATINPQIIDGLYGEALVLSDEVRTAFTLPSADLGAAPELDIVRVALSSEGLRTTTRIMHATAWLLNHRAYFMGELSEFQLRRYGRLSPDLERSNEANLALLSLDIRDLVETTERFYERLLRLDRDWQLSETGEPSAILRLRERLARKVAGNANDTHVRS